MHQVTPLNYLQNAHAQKHSAFARKVFFVISVKPESVHLFDVLGAKNPCASMIFSAITIIAMPMLNKDSKEWAWLLRKWRLYLHYCRSVFHALHAKGPGSDGVSESGKNGLSGQIAFNFLSIFGHLPLPC